MVIWLYVRIYGFIYIYGYGHMMVETDSMLKSLSYLALM